MQPAYQAADFLLGGRSGTPILEAAGIRFQITAEMDGIEQERGEALEVGSRGSGVLLRLRRSLRTSREFVEANGYGLAEVHGAMLFACGDAQEPMAMAESFIRKTPLLRSEK